MSSRPFVRRIGAVVASSALLAGGLGAVTTSPAQAVPTFTNKTTTNGLGSNYVYGVFAVGTTVYAGTDGGLSISTDSGTTWTNKTNANSGLGDDPFYNPVYGVYAIGSTVYAATEEGLSISTNSGATFINRNAAGGLGGNYVTGVYAVAGSPNNTVYAALGGGGLSISTDGGATFDNYTTADGLGNDVVYGVYAIGSTVYAATAGGLSISTDGDATFTNRTSGASPGNGLGSNTVRGVYAVGSTVYAATGGGLSISTDGGATFTNKTVANSGLGSNDMYGVYAVAGSPHNTVYAALGVSGLSISTDGGTSFTNYTTANGLGSNAVSGVYAVGSTIYAATVPDRGIGGGLSISSSDSGGSSAPGETRVGPPDEVQQVAQPAAGCENLSLPSLDWAGVSSGGWAPSWAEWVNGGRGGPVCTRTLAYSPSTNAWFVRP